MTMDQKGIATADLLFATLIAIVIMASMVATISNETSKSQSGDLGNVRIISEKVAESVNIVYTNGPGYALNLTLTNVSTTSNYTITVDNDGVLANFTGKTIKINIIPKTNVSTVTLNQGQKYMVQNINGSINITAI
jgi:hypothetical protein